MVSWGHRTAAFCAVLGLVLVGVTAVAGMFMSGVVGQTVETMGITVGVVGLFLLVASCVISLTTLIVENLTRAGGSLRR